MFERDISEQVVINTIKKGKRIAEYPEDKPLPSFLTYSGNPKNPLHVVFAEDDNRCIVITVYRPDQKDWNDDFTEKRSNI